MKLPPMNSLRAFEAVSRHGSVSKAADELCVSQGAVSQQIKNLEGYLGQALFQRGPNSFELSDDGEIFAETVQQSLQAIARVASELTGSDTRKTLTISLWRGFAVKWVMPNLGSFYAKHPEINVALDESVGLVTFKNDGIDGAIRFADGNFENLESALLFHPKLYAVASPEYVREHGRLDSLCSPGEHILVDHLYKKKQVRAQHVHWQDLVRDAEFDLESRQIVLPDEHQAINAAAQGRGIALAPEYIISEELADGKLEIVNPEWVPARFQHYFVYPSDRRPSASLLAFRDWLVDSLAKYRE